MSNDSRKRAWDETASIHLRMMRAGAEIAHIPATRFAMRNNGAVVAEFDAISIHTLAPACLNALAAHGAICIFQLVSWRQEGIKSVVDMRADFINVDDPTDRESVLAVGEGNDKSDKGFNKAISAARKNALVQGLNLAMGSDVEVEEIETGRNHKAAKAPAAQNGTAVTGVLLDLGNGREEVADTEVVARVTDHIATLDDVADIVAFESDHSEVLRAWFGRDKKRGLMLRRIIDAAKTKRVEAAA